MCESEQEVLGKTTGSVSFDCFRLLQAHNFHGGSPLTERVTWTNFNFLLQIFFFLKLNY